MSTGKPIKGPKDLTPAEAQKALPGLLNAQAVINNAIMIPDKLSYDLICKDLDDHIKHVCKLAKQVAPV